MENSCMSSRDTVRHFRSIHTIDLLSWLTHPPGTFVEVYTTEEHKPGHLQSVSIIRLVWTSIPTETIPSASAHLHSPSHIPSLRWRPWDKLVFAIGHDGPLVEAVERWKTSISEGWANAIELVAQDGQGKEMRDVNNIDGWWTWCGRVMCVGLGWEKGWRLCQLDGGRGGWGGYQGSEYCYDAL